MLKRRRAHIVRRDGHTVSEDYGKCYAPDKFVEWGSITKLVTAQAVCALADSGRLDLSAPVREELGFLPQSVTIRGLLTHTSGLPRVHSGMPVGVFSDPYAGVTPALLRHQLELVQEGDLLAPGEMTYSNLGYAVLGMLLQHVTGRPWFEAVTDLVLTPWGLTDVVSLPAIDQRVHIRGFDRKPHQPWALATSPYAAAGALWSPLSALAEYGQRSLVEGAFHRPERGWQAGESSWWHNGQTRDSGSCLVVIPDERLVVATHALAAFPGAADRLAAKLSTRWQQFE